MKILRLTLIILILVPVAAFAQDWGKKFMKDLGKGLGDTGAQQKAKFDSIDFQFAFSENESSGLFNVQNKGEDAAGALYFLKEKGDKSINEIARDTLEYALRLYEMRAYKLAMQGFENAKSFMESKQLINSISYLRCISNIGLVYLTEGRTLDAEHYIDTALQVSDRVLGKKSAAYSANLNSRAKLYQQTGKYNEAEKLFDEAEGLIVQVFGKNTMQNAIIMNNKAMLYQTMGRYQQAVELMKKAIVEADAAPKKALQGKNSFDSRRFQSNLALLYQLSGDLTSAETSFLSIKKVFENRAQTSNPEYAQLLNQMGLLYMQMGKMDQVEPLLQKSAAVYKKKFTEENPSFAKVQNDLGSFYRIQGRYPEAEATLQKAIAIRKTTLGENHPDYVKSVDNLGVLYWKKGDLPKAYTFLNESMTKSLDFVSQYFPPMSEAEKAKYWDILQPRFQRFYNYAVEASPTQPEILNDVYDYQIATKALLLSSTNKIKKAILASGDKTLIDDYTSWIGQKEMLARCYALSKEELKQQNVDIQALEKQANAAEKSLSERSTDFSKAYTTEKISFVKVASLLNDTEAIVEVIRVRGFDKDFTDQSRYVALVLTRGSTVPKMVVMENGNEMETKGAKGYKNSIIGRLPDARSYGQFWEKIDPLVTGKKMIYLSPDGVYNQININTLKKPDGDFLENRFDIVTIGNSRDIIAIKGKKPVTKKDAFILGFPDFGDAAPALPGTKMEIDGIAKILKTAGYTITQREQKLATEANLKAVKAPALMHIATHGYFLADTDIGNGAAMGINAENARNNPLLRSGLILSGAPDPNKEEQTADLQSNDNGILTAYEAMNLNLEGTDLIVLSACETGLGDVKAGEGVYGLQRAFLVAGANALIMSLWKVDDAATQMLMTSFYTNWSKGGSKLKAFKAAQLQLMAKYKDPYYWGAFVMMGM